MRTNPSTGAIERPWRQRDRENNGAFVLTDPANGALRHHKENAIMVASYSETLEMVQKGFSIRMSDGRSPPSLVSPASLTFIDEPVERIDDLWSYTMPEVPFSIDAVMQDLRKHLLSQASDIGLLATADAASAFIGFEFNPFDDNESSVALETINLERFNVTRIVRRAYESAFRPWPSEDISEDDIDELEQILTGSMVRFQRRHGSPLDREGSALQRTVIGAYYRWQIADGCFLDKEEIDQGATEAIAALTGMPANAVRNALSRDGLSLVKAKIDREALINWIITRRNFAPLRQSETRAERGTWRVLNELRQKDLQTAFVSVRSDLGHASRDLDAAEEAISSRRAAGQVPSEAELRRYAQALGIAPDNLILELHNDWGGG